MSAKTKGNAMVRKTLEPAKAKQGMDKMSDEMTGEERARIAVMRPAVNSGIAAMVFSPIGAIDVEEFAQCVEDEVNEGDSLKVTERILLSQAHALDALFAGLARRAALNMGTHLGATETYLRLAMRAQSQCRATLETLAAIKNPPVVFAKQANIAHGHQQVNNGTGVAHAGETEKPQPELLEHDHGERLDTGAATAAIGSDQAVATVVEIHRPAQRRGQSRIKP